MKSDAVESYTPGTTLTLDGTTYTYPVADSKKWIGTCRSLTLRFRSGATATALFTYRK